jgi:hypothetical protein
VSAAVHAVPAYMPRADERITHDVEWDYDSFDLAGAPCVETDSFQAYGIEHARELERLCKADVFKRNVRIVARLAS